MYKKKSLGQHFLSSTHYLGLVADAAEVKKGDTVLEIGPGEGALTEVLLARGARVIAIEKDARLIPVLEERFAGKPLTVLEMDALDADLASLRLRKFKVVGNIPYYITGALLRKFLTEERQPELLVFLMQKEVAERITGHPSTRSGSQKESILSLSVKAYGAPLYIKTVPRGAFSPPPNVDSAILKVSGVSRGNFDSAAHEARFFTLVKKGFSSKRKKLLGNIGKEYSDILKNIGVSLDARAEDVALAQWLEISRSH